jgi:hypothetical protein
MARLFSSTGVKWIAGGWTAFILENVVLSHNREWIISEYGKDKYHMTYNTLSTAACSSIIYGYLKHGRGKGPRMGSHGIPGVVASFILQGVGFAIISQQAPKLQNPFQMGEMRAVSSGQPAPAEVPKSSSKLFVRCPMDFRPADVPEDGIYGTARISRHATFWAFGSICYGEAITALFLPEVVMFSFPLIFAAIGTAHQDYRYRRASGGILTPEMEAITSNVPFLAFVAGAQSWEQLFKEIKWTNAGIGLTVAAAFALRNIRRLK